MRSATCYFLCFSLCISVTAFAQQFSLLPYTVNDGLPSNQITSLCEDSNGFLWIGTSNGLSRFNGRSFVNYGYTEGLQDLFVSDIFEDRLHRLWIGTLHGISELKGNRIVTCKIKDNAEFRVCTFIKINEQEVWASTTKGLYHYADSLWLPVDTTSGYNLPPCTQFISTPQGMYINYEDKLVLQTDKERVILALPAPGDSYGNLLECDHRLFISTRKAIYEIVHRTLKLLIDDIPVQTFFLYYIDRDDNCWVFVQNKGLYYYTGLPHQKKRVAFVYNMTNGLGFLFADKAGALWLASFEGLIRVRPKMFSEIYTDRKTSYQKRPYIAAAGDGRLLIFSAGGPQYYRNGKTGTLPLPTCYGDLSHYLQDVVEGSCRDSSNNIWFITRLNKLFCFKSGRFRDFSPLLAPQQKEYIFNLAADRLTNRIFLCGDSTVMAGNEKHFDVYRDRNGRQLPRCTWVLFTRTGTGVVNVFQKGVYFITRQNEIIKAPRELDIIAKGLYTYFFEDRKGYIWVSNAGKGLIRFRITDDYKVKEVLQLSTGNGLPDNRIISMAFDTRQGIWINTNKDVAVLKKDEKNSAVFSIYTLGWQEGILQETSSSAQLTADDSGNVWIPFQDRILQFNTGQLQLTKQVPDIVIEKVLLNMKETDWAARRDSLSGYFQLPYHPNLPYSQNSLGIQYTGACLTDASRLEYTYRITPLDTNWSAPSVNTLVSILNLAPGEYTFQVRARASESAWSEPATFAFAILRPFWETWWFRSVVVLLASGIIVGVFRYRLRQVKAQAALKNKLLQLETKALKAQMNPHFIYNALNSIQSLILNNQPRQAGSYISKFARLLQQILENADTNAITLDKELQSLRLYIALEELRLNFELKYKEEIGENMRADEERIPPLILQPFVENALWHGLSKKTGERILHLKIKADDEWITCEIFDNGIGRKKATEQYNIFPEGHLSKASAITLQRLTNFNQPQAAPPISFIDHTDGQGEAAGTTVIIKIRRMGWS